jgi:Fe-S-cluster containining protein
MRRGWQRAALTQGVARLRADGLERADARLLRVLDDDFAEASRLAGERLACAPGCSDCCIGPFPITRLDARRLRAGLERLAAEEPARADAVRGRAERAVALLADDYPGDPASGRLEVAEARLDRFFERHAGLACPALDPASGRCDLYAWRPVSCRTYGPPVRFGDELAPPCDLCFVGADESAVEACRVEPDRDGLEQAILAALGVRGGEDWETLIAYALAGERATF